jgi:hypothetical protein
MRKIRLWRMREGRVEARSQFARETGHVHRPRASRGLCNEPVQRAVQPCPEQISTLAPTHPWQDRHAPAPDGRGPGKVCQERSS